MNEFGSLLQSLCLGQGLTLPESTIDRLALHWQLVREANRAFNLTAITQDGQAAEKHYLDSLLALPVLRQLAPQRVADIGSGGGFPGLVLAAACPELDFLLLEASAKKAAFLADCAARMELPRVQVQQLRAEKAGRDPLLRRSFDLVTARAVAHTAVLCEYALPLLRPGGRLLLYKGPGFPQEAAEAAHALAELNGSLGELRQYTLPQSGEQRILGQVIAGESCNEKYPRREGMPEKRPL